MRARPIPLECGHVVNMPTPLPDCNEQLYCYRCADYVRSAPAKAGTMTISYYDGWRSTPKGYRRYEGECLADGCGYRHTEHNFYRVRDHMEKHLLTEHGTHPTATAEIARRIKEAHRHPVGEPPY